MFYSILSISQFLLEHFARPFLLQYRFLTLYDWKLFDVDFLISVIADFPFYSLLIERFVSSGVDSISYVISNNIMQKRNLIFLISYQSSKDSNYWPIGIYPISCTWQLEHFRNRRGSVKEYFQKSECQCKLSWSHERVTTAIINSI